MRTKRVALAAAGVALMAASMTACGDSGPECLEGHTVVSYASVYNPTTKRTTIKPVTSYICDRYAEVTDNDA